MGMRPLVACRVRGVAQFRVRVEEWEGLRRSAWVSCLVFWVTLAIFGVPRFPSRSSALDLVICPCLVVAAAP